MVVSLLFAGFEAHLSLGGDLYIAKLQANFGAGSSMGLMWDLADVLMGCMAIINLPVICILGGPALKAMDDYSKQREAGKNPVFKARSIGITQKLDYWQD